MPTIELLRTIMYVLAAFTCIVLVGSAICWRLKRTMMNIEQHSRDYTEKSEASQLVTNPPWNRAPRPRPGQCPQLRRCLLFPLKTLSLRLLLLQSPRRSWYIR